MSPIRPEDPNDMTALLNNYAARLRALERAQASLRLPDGANPLQTFENGSPLGDTRFLDFGEGVLATLIGDGYVRVTGAGGGVSPYDALVDGTLTSSKPDDREFMGIGEALTYLKDVVGLDNVVVVVRPYPGVETVGYLETANWTTPTIVRLIGLRGVTPLMASPPDLASWSWNGFKPSTVGGLRMENMFFRPQNYGTIPLAAFEALNSVIFMTSATQSVALCDTSILDNCAVLYPGVVAGTWRWATNDFNLINTQVTFSGAAAKTWVPSVNGPFTMLASGLNYAATLATVTLPTEFDLDIDSSLGREGGNIGPIPSLTVPSGAQGRIHARYNAGFGSPAVTATSAFEELDLEGTFAALTITGTHDALRIRGTQQASVWDIRGPATLDASVRGSARFIIRGEGVAGQIAADTLTGSSGTFLDFIAADKCNIHVGADPTGTSGTKKSYAFDASSDNNGLWFEDSGWPVTGTNAGTNNLILPSAIPGGSSAPSTADYLVGTAQASLSAEIVVGTTPGGELGGTWAAPTVDATHSGSPHGVAIEDEGAAEGQALTVDFTGDGVSVGFAGTEATVTIPGVGTPTAGWGSITNVTVDRAYDANATTLDEIADVLGQLVADLIAQGVIAT